MTRGSQAERPIDFFISYSPADERWATWMAWELETAGYRTLLQAWDFVPGTNFIDFMDRGVSEAAVVIAVLSTSYLGSRYGRLEWQAALRADPDNLPSRLVTVRVEDCPLEGLLSMITYLDLVGVEDVHEARSRLLGRIRQALAGRAKPPRRPEFPSGRPRGGAGPDELPVVPVPPTRAPMRRRPVSAPAYPPAQPRAGGERSEVTLLHVAGPRFGRGLVDEGVPLSAGDLQARIWGELTRLAAEGAPQPDLLVVTGDLTESGGLREFDAALAFLTGLRVLLGLEPNRLVVVPGGHDVTRAACRAYFATCEADDVEPQPPYWPKWRHFARLFDELYQGLADLAFDAQQPWTLFAVPDLQVVLAGLNSTMVVSHREEDHYGWVGEAQAAWFAQRLRPFEQAGWLRVGAVCHVPVAPDGPGGAVADMVAGREPVYLRDTATVDQLLGARLNLLLHGQSPRGTAMGRLGSGLLTVPAAGPGSHQLLRLTADGLTRWAGTAAMPERAERHWHAATAAFGTAEPPAHSGADGRDGGAGAGAGEPWSVPEPVEPEWAGDPTGQLLDRIAEVCQTRYERAKIRRVPGECPHLLVTYPEDGFVRQVRVGAHVGEPARADVEAFLRQVYGGGEPDLGSELVYEGPPPPQLLRGEALRRGVSLRSFTEFQGLLDLRGFVAEQTARLRADRQYPPGLYVPQRYTELVGPDQSVREGLAEELLRLLATDEGRFVLVLGDFGRGKTFALREVARRIPAELPHLVPILIELRALDKSHSVDGLVAAHLANHGEELIDLKAFRYMLRQGRIVLLFDGFDELVTRVTYDRAADHLDTLLRSAEDRAKIVVASRTQHFKTHAQVFTALGERVGLLPHRRVMSVEDFTPAQIRAYLVNRYGGDEEAADARLSLISGIQDLLGLSRNPRMLSFIADLDRDRLHAVAKAKHTISAAGLYEEILRAWLVYEERRTQGIPGAPVGLALAEMWQAVTTLAIRLWESGESFLRLAELADVAETLTGLTDGQVASRQAVHAVGTGSLLVRTEEGLFGFIHGSVVEWLVANEIAHRLEVETEPVLLSRRPLSQLTVDFLCDLAPSGACQEWVERVLADQAADEVTRGNAVRIGTRLRTPAWTDLRGAQLKGEDLSYREFVDVDLTGADLTDARLVGADLSRAVLRDARLTGARLDEAVLAGADLRGADLTRARLLRSDLRGVAVTGSRWRRAALIDVTANPNLAQAGELHGAAVAPGQPVEVEFAPAAIGVPYGIHPTSGRLPEPVAYSPHSGTLAVGSEDGGVLVCDAVSGLPLRTLQGHRGRVYAVRYGTNDGPLVTGASDRTVRLWDRATGEQLAVLEGHRDWVWPVLLSPDDALVATGDGAGVMRLWDAATGTCRAELAGHAWPIYTAAFLGRRLAVGDSTGVIRVWNVETGELLHAFDGGGGAVYRVAFSPDGAVLAAGEDSGTVRLWDSATGEVRHALAGHAGSVYSLDFQPRGALLASADTRGEIRLWDPATGAARGALRGHTGVVYRVTFSPDGTLLASGDSDGAVRLWDAATGQQRHDLAGHKGPVWPVVFRPDGRQLVTTSNDGTTRLWDPATGQVRQVLRGHGRRVVSARFSLDGTMLATCGNDGVVRLWNPRTGQRRGELTGIADRLVSAVFNPSRPQLATASNDGGVYLWDAHTGEYERELDVGTDHVWATAFSPDGTVLATANDDDTVRLWSRSSGRHMRTFAEHRGRVRSIAFSPDGSMVATGCDDTVVRLYDTASGRCVELAGHGDRVYSVAFSADGAMLASASNDGTARLWRTTGQAGPSGPSGPVRVLSGHTGRLWSAAFSPDGTVLATAGDDLAVRLWDTRTGERLRDLVAHTQRVWSVDFCPDGSLLASAGDDGTVRLWDVTDPPAAALKVTLLGLPEGWAALAPDGRYKLDGDVAGQFWAVIGMCRFEPGELDPYLPEVTRLPLDARF